tara:strand:+ start:664 stop:954 length:291 start_codon:yes stop_codon:yes gene_type:complete
MIKKNKRLLIIISAITLLLLLPFVSMQFSDQVNWSIFDFLIAGLLFYGTGFLLELIFRKVTTRKRRTILIICLFLVALLIWIELAVGIFGSPIAGS